MLRASGPFGALVLTAALIGSASVVAASASDIEQVNRPARGNADRLDGMDSTEFAYAKGKTLALDYYAVELDLNENGDTDTIAALAECPRGTQATGGGGADFTATGATIFNAPVEDEGWLFAVWVDEGAHESSDDVFGSIVCYSPHGKEVRGSYKPRRSELSKQAVETLRSAVLPKLSR